MGLFENQNNNGKKKIATKLKGRRLLQSPRLNKGSAFSKKERLAFDLLGLLPNHQETLEEQKSRVYELYKKLDSNLDKHVFLRQIRNQNETLFYYLIEQHFEEILPIIYTPTIGEAVQNFSKINIQTRGLFIAYPDKKEIKNLIAPYKNYPIKVVIITDGEGVLGIGDQGVGGINIAIAKGNLYALLAGIEPSSILPIQIDVGTNNQELRENSNYLGWQHKRIKGQQYYEFIDKVIKTLAYYFPSCLIHWEDFARDNGQNLLKKYQDSLCTFNDDIQGTGAVALATILTALSKKNQCLTQQKIIIYGAGSAGIGIAEQISQGMQELGLSNNEARENIWLIDRPGILYLGLELTREQQPYAKKRQEWMQTETPLLSCIENTGASIIIGCSAQSGHFTKECIISLCKNDPHPIIMPLSNPTYKSEITPQNAIDWSNGKAFVATGSPFPPIKYQEQTIKISQCNNMFIFPGLGRGVCTAKAKKISQGMIMAACQALAKFSHKSTSYHQLLPNITQCKEANLAVCKAVIKQSIREQISEREIIDINKTLKSESWTPKYLPYVFKDETHD